MPTEIELLKIEDPAYPSLLAQIHKPPAQLYYRGDSSLLNQPNMLGVVGSRKASEYGKEVCDNILSPLVKNNIIIVSGLAYGIDSYAHHISVRAKQPTIAVLGCGVDDASIYPKENVPLAHSILLAGGLLISEYKPGTPPSASQFPARNRIIAGLCTATLVIQAAKRSGSLITARLALEEGREVLAVPGPVTDPACEGTNMLIRDGAEPILTSADILHIFHLEEAQEEQRA